VGDNSIVGYHGRSGVTSPWKAKQKSSSMQTVAGEANPRKRARDKEAFADLITHLTGQISKLTSQN